MRSTRRESGIRWLLSVASIALGLFVLRLSFTAHGKWRDLLALGDPSGAEVYEIEFWPEAVVGVALIALGGFVAGRASWARRGD
jgi:hypothetical protein